MKIVILKLNCVMTINQPSKQLMYFQNEDQVIALHEIMPWTFHNTKGAKLLMKNKIVNCLQSTNDVSATSTQKLQLLLLFIKKSRCISKCFASNKKKRA